MPFFSRSDLLRLQESLGVRLDKSRGQCYLTDKNILGLIHQFAHLNPATDVVLEIGAGLGTLSDLLIEHSRQAILIENDRKIATFLHHQYSSRYQTSFYDFLDPSTNDAAKPDLSAPVVILLADALRIPFPKADKIVANIPYQISAPLLFKIIKEWAYEQVNLMVQEEFAHRLVASPNTKQYSRLSASVGLFFDISIDHIVPPGSFFPPPKVKSALISIKRKQLADSLQHAWENREKYFLFLRAIFPYKNKSVRNAVKIGIKNSEMLTQIAPHLNQIVQNPDLFKFAQLKLRSLPPESIYQILEFGITGDYSSCQLIP